MDQVCVITGGGSGMGLETAKLLGKTQKVILVGRTVSKLEDALGTLKDQGVDAVSFACDVSDHAAVQRLAAFAQDQGTVKTVIHAAGVSPHMTSAEHIFSINALGTIYVDEAFAGIMPEGGVILNVSSMSAYMLPPDRVPLQLYQLALSNPDALIAATAQMFAAVPQQQQTGMAYTISKNFAVWYTARMAVRCGRQGIRVVSISPGTFHTPLGELEGESAAVYAERGALGRVGESVEIAQMMAFMVSDACSYLTGVDILYDGGAIAAMNAMLQDRKQ